MSRYIRFGYSESGMVHFFHNFERIAEEEGPVCGNHIRGSGWTGTATERHTIKGDDFCQNCLKKVDLPWEEE